MDRHSQHLGVPGGGFKLEAAAAAGFLAAFWRIIAPGRALQATQIALSPSETSLIRVVL